jgi:predicted NAD/FAD-binding protein
MGQNSSKSSPADAAAAQPLVRTRICVVGAGAAGIAAAWSLSRHPDKFQVEVWEKAAVAGGVATSEDVGNGQYINDGVQGGSVAYRNTILLMNDVGFRTSPVHMKISFGKGESAWNNHGPAWRTKLVERLRPEIARFGRLLKTMSRFEKVFIFIPIDTVLSTWRFSADFRFLMVYPLIALFFGTGNQTPRVSSAIVARVFLDPDMRLFDYDSELLLSQTPEMFAFPRLSELYAAWVKRIEDSGCAVFRFNCAVASVDRTSQSARGKVVVRAADGRSDEFDEIVFACDAELPLRVLDRTTRMERFALGNVRYFNDITVTHEDHEYMQKHYDMHPDRPDQYFIRIHPDNLQRVDMSFNLSNYQPQLVGQPRAVYQTIFLDDTHRESWTMDEIREDKILLKKWWRQFAHTHTHFAFTVPFVRFLQGKHHTWYCGAYTLFNTHEIAIISGLAVAERLGAPYPFAHDSLALKQFDMYMEFIHGQKRAADGSLAPTAPTTPTTAAAAAAAEAAGVCSDGSTSDELCGAESVSSSVSSAETEQPSPSLVGVTV